METGTRERRCWERAGRRGKMEREYGEGEPQKTLEDLPPVYRT